MKFRQSRTNLRDLWQFWGILGAKALSKPNKNIKENITKYDRIT